MLNPEEWNQRILAHPDGSFLQSFEWGEFQASLGRPVRRMLVGERVPIQSVRMPLALGVSYEFISRGPAADDNSASQLAAGLHELGRNAGALFVRCEPPWPASRAAELAVAGFRRTAAVQPETTWVLDLAPAETELLAGMHPKTRYNIRVAERHGVRVREVGLGGYPDFWQLLSHTADRGGFKTHGSRYHRFLAERFAVAGLGSVPFIRPVAQIFVAEYKQTPIAAAFVMVFGRSATYLYGGTSDQHREVMASHLLHWEIIRRVRAVGCNRYDLWGIASQSGAMPHQHQQQKEWAGFTRFKQGFGGRAVEYVGAWDLVLRTMPYQLYRFLRSVRRSI